MRFSVTGNDKDTGQPIEITLDAADVPAAAALAEKKGIFVTAVRPLKDALSPAIPAYRSDDSAVTQLSDMPWSAPPSKPKARIWLGLFLLTSGILAPFFPGYTLGVGIALTMLLLLYLLVEPMRPGLSRFLRLSPDKSVWRAARLTMFGVVAIVLMSLAAGGYAVQRSAVERAAKEAAAEAARVEAEAKANAQVSDLVGKAKAALAVGNTAKAEQLIQEALKNTIAPNWGLASSLLTSIKNAGDKEWTLDVLTHLSDSEFEAFKRAGNPPAAFDFAYAVLTDRAVTNARAQFEDAISRRAEIKRKAEALAEARRKQAEQQQRQGIAAAEAARKAAEMRAAEEKARQQAFQKEVDDKLDRYMAFLDAVEVKLIDTVSVQRHDERWTATLTVNNIWHLRHYQLRYQDAQTLWKAWAIIACPNDKDSARISLVDTNGNEVGGSRIWGGSLIWVQEN